MKSQQDPTTRAVKFSPDWCKFFWAKRQNPVSLRMRWLILTFVVKFVQLGALPGNSTAATREIWLIGVVSCKRLNLLSITLQSTRKQNKIKFCTNLQSWELHRFWAVNRTVRKRLIEKNRMKRSTERPFRFKIPKLLSDNAFLYCRILQKIVQSFTSITTRPAGLPPMVISKKTLGFDIAELTRRRDEDNKFARIGRVNLQKTEDEVGRKIRAGSFYHVVLHSDLPYRQHY